MDWALGTTNLRTGQYNVANWAPADVDTLLRRGEATSNGAKAFAVYTKVLTRIQQDVPLVPLFLTDGVYAIAHKYSWSVNPFTGYNGTWPLGIKSR
jgi:ABC-type transport system substrate-binding protein